MDMSGDVASCRIWMGRQVAFDLRNIAFSGGDLEGLEV